MTLITRRSLLAGLAVLPVLGACTQQDEQTSGTAGKTYQIGIAQIVSHPSLDAIREGFKAGMKDAGFTNVEFDEQNPQGDQGALAGIASTFAAKDLVFAITTPIAQAMAQAITDKPIVFGGVTDPVSAKLIDSFDKPGANLTGVSDYPPMERQMELITQLKPGAKTIGMVAASGEANASFQTEMAKTTAAALGLSLKVATVTNSSEIQQAATSLKGVDAFFVSNDNTVVSGIDTLVQVAEESKAIVVASDPDSVKRGAAAALAVDQFQMGHEAAGMAVKILKDGLKPADIPSIRAQQLTLSVNEKAAERQGTPIPQAVLDKADTKVSD